MEPGSDVNKVESIFLEEKKFGSFCYMYLVKRGGGNSACGDTTNYTNNDSDIIQSTLPAANSW